MVKAALLGVPVGLAFGYALQRGRFCMNTANTYARSNV